VAGTQCGAADGATETVTPDQVLTQAGGQQSDAGNSELAGGGPGANAEPHLARPYEPRTPLLGGSPAWCEVVDDDPDRGRKGALFGSLRRRGYGLMLVRRTTAGLERSAA
jgi:hypothetical protein